ncbi:MAG TPA: PEGA domain-containing protein [Polyangia bacterium]|nr:PEGA domain-containing protein [Polyangia bacterium]
MSRRGRTMVGVVGLLAVMVVPAPARAALRYAVYPLGSLALEPQELARVERALVAGLAVVPEARVLERKAVERMLTERRNTRLALCEGDLPCLAAVGKALGVDRVIAGEAGGLGGSGFVLYLRVVEAASGKEVASMSAVLKGDDRGLRASAREAAFRLIAPERYLGRLSIKADVPGASVYIDGQRVATLPSPPLPLAVGPHALRLSHEAYRDFMRFVDIEFDKTTEISAGMTAFPVISEQMRARGVRDPVPGGGNEVEDGRAWYRRWWAVTAFGVVLAAATTAIVIGAADRIDADYRVKVGPPPR